MEDSAPLLVQATTPLAQLQRQRLLARVDAVLAPVGEGGVSEEAP